MIIIGITGTISAGKGAIVEFFKKRGFVHYSARAFLSKEVVKRGLPLNRDTVTATANDLRREHGPGYIIESLYGEAVKAGQNAIIESIRTVAEIDFLKVSDARFLLIAVDADKKVRYKRAVGRNSALDQISFEKFVSDEDRELTSTDPNKQNISASITRADMKIVNDGSLAELHEKLERVCEGF